MDYGTYDKMQYNGSNTTGDRRRQSPENAIRCRRLGHKYATNNNSQCNICYYSIHIALPATSIAISGSICLMPYLPSPIYFIALSPANNIFTAISSAINGFMLLRVSSVEYPNKHNGIRCSIQEVETFGELQGHILTLGNGFEDQLRKLFGPHEN
jgi:ribosomal protein L37E